MPAQFVDNLLIWSAGTFYIQALADMPAPAYAQDKPIANQSQFNGRPSFKIVPSFPRDLGDEF
jgi:hypothetical protein